MLESVEVTRDTALVAEENWTVKVNGGWLFEGVVGDRVTLLH